MDNLARSAVVPPRQRPTPTTDHRALRVVPLEPARSVGELAERWLAANADATSAEDYASFVRTHVTPWAAELPVADITAAELTAWEAARKADKYSVSRLSTLRWMWKAMLAHGGVRLDTSAMPVLRKAKVSARRKEILTPTEVATLVASQRGPAFRRALAVGLMLTGMRIGELIALRRSDVDETMSPLPALRVARAWRTKARKFGTTKDKAERLIPLGAAVWRAILEVSEECYSRRERDGSELLFPFLPSRWPGAQREPRAWNQRTALKHWHELLAEHDMQPRTLHATRHTFVSIAEHYSRDPIAVHAITHPASIPSSVSEGGGSSSFGRYHHVFYERSCAAVESIRLPLVEATLEPQLTLALEAS